MSARRGGPMVHRHLDGTECLHALVPDSFSAEGLRCTVTNLDVLLDDGVPLVPVYPLIWYLDGPRRRHRGETPGMFESWPHALLLLGLWSALSGLILGGLIGLVRLLPYVFG